MLKIALTVAGYGVVTPKTNLGKLLVIVYASISMPVALSYLANVGAVVSKFIEWIMLRVHTCVKGDKPLRYKNMKRWLYLFIIFWLVCLVVVLNYVFVTNAFMSTGAKRWLDGFYFMFVTFTTIGFGDVIGPSFDFSFYISWFFLGLASSSALVDSFMSLMDQTKFSLRAENAVCCCLTCNEEDTTTTATPEEADANSS